MVKTVACFQSVCRYYLGLVAIDIGSASKRRKLVPAESKWHEFIPQVCSDAPAPRSRLRGASLCQAASVRLASAQWFCQVLSG